MMSVKLNSLPRMIYVIEYTYSNWMLEVRNKKKLIDNLKHFHQNRFTRIKRWKRVVIRDEHNENKNSISLKV